MEEQHNNDWSQAAKAIRAAAADAPGDKMALYKLADKIEHSFPELEKSAQHAHKNKDHTSQQAFAALAAEVTNEESRTLEGVELGERERVTLISIQTRGSLGKAVALSTPSPQEQAAKIAAHTAAEIDRLTTALESGDKATAERALAQLRGPAQEQLLFAKALAELSGDPAVIASAGKAVSLTPELITASYPTHHSPFMLHPEYLFDQNVVLEQ